MRHTMLFVKKVIVQNYIYKKKAGFVPCGSLLYIIGVLNLNPMIIIIVYEKRF